MKTTIALALIVFAASAQTTTTIVGPVRDAFNNPYTGSFTVQSQAKTNTGYAVTGTVRTVYVSAGAIGGFSLIPNDTSTPNLTSYLLTFANGDKWICIVPTSATPIPFTQACSPNATPPNASQPISVSQLIPSSGDGDVLATRAGISKWTPRQGSTLPPTCTKGDSFLLTSYLPFVNEACVVTGTPGVWAQVLGAPTLGGVPLLSPSLGPNGIPPVIVPLTTGYNDIYTAPSCTLGVIGCNRQYVDVLVGAISSTGSMVVNGALKRAGVYYSIGAGTTGATASATVTAGSTATLIQTLPFLLLDPGDTVSVFVASTTGGVFQATLSHLSFDSNTPLRMFTALAPQSGSNIAVYTPPTGKTGTITSNAGLPFRTLPALTLDIDGSISGPTSFNLYIAPTGTVSLSSAYQFASVNTSTGPLALGLVSPAIVPPGYTLYLTTSANSVSTILWGWVFEY